MLDSFTLSVLEYACEIWSAGVHHQELERIQLRFFKTMLGVKDSTATAAIYTELGRFPLHIRSKVRIIKYWIRLSKCQSNFVLSKCFNMSKKLDDLGYKSWFSNVRKILIECDLLFYLDEGVDTTNCIKDVKLFLYTDFINTCMQSLNSFPILRSYVKFKFDFRLESYLLTLIDSKLRKVISKFRLSSHNLNIEAGRHTKPKTPLELRLCTKCTSGVVETELHFLLECDNYNHLRGDFFKVIKHIDPSILQGNNDEVFIKILSSKEEQVIFSLAKYLSKSFKTRKD